MISLNRHISSVVFIFILLNELSSPGFVVSFQDVKDCGESRDREGRTSSRDKEEKKGCPHLLDSKDKQ